MLSEDLEVLLTDEKQAREFAKRAIREKRFIQKVQRMVKDVECGDSNPNSKLGEFDKLNTQRLPSTKEFTGNPCIADCWRWIKGLLYDFINLKKYNTKLEKQYSKLNCQVQSQNRSQTHRTNHTGMSDNYDIYSNLYSDQHTTQPKAVYSYRK